VNNLLWVLLALLALVLSWFAESTLLAWVACFLMLMLIICRLLVYIGPRLQAERSISANYLHQGEQAQIRIKLHSTRRHWGWLIAGEADPPLPFKGHRGVMLGALSGKQSEFTYTLEAARRGYFVIGPLSALYGDPLGFAERKRTLLASESITVFPRIFGLGRMHLPIARSPGELHTQRRTFEDPTRPAGIREYRQGDALRRVHWRATAHMGKPQSKLYDVSTSLQAMLLLNLYRPDYAAGQAELVQASELAISVAASLSLHLLSAGQRVGLISNGLDIKERETVLQKTGVSLLPESLARLSDELAVSRRVWLAPSRAPERSLEILSLLARLQPVQGRPLALLLKEVRPQLSWGEVLILLTPSVEGEVVDSLVGLTHAGFSVLPIVIGDSAQAARTIIQLTAARLCPHRLMTEEDISGLFA
jgi:uncharacterized protein (DUF58 family)